MESPVVEGAAPGPELVVEVEAPDVGGGGGAEIVAVPGSMEAGVSVVEIEGGSAAGRGGAVTVTVGAGGVVLAIEDLASMRVFTGAHEQDVRCAAGETTAAAAGAAGAAWKEESPPASPRSAIVARRSSRIAPSPATGPGVAGSAAGVAGSAEGVASAGAAAGATSVGVAPTPNAVGSTPTLLSTTGGAGAVAAALAAGFGLAGTRLTWLVTMGTFCARCALRRPGCVANGALIVDGCAFRGAGTRSMGNWRVGATTVWSVWILAGGWERSARANGAVYSRTTLSVPTATNARATRPWRNATRPNESAPGAAAAA